ncbi:MAG TPA: aromatic ring-hydroxylating dioxygenase subunit alpha [Acetobacteraceae bacterium]|nr:aromatic ring-hydroxylating dioxygenase subunit alpha [Acetobacteraceae bacterium]
MVTRAPFLKARYSGYHHRQVPKEDTELTHVGPETPCGEYMRRFWQPICYSDELKDLPLAVKVLGEELVVFRDGSGAVGLLERHCSHRGTSLEFGLVGAKGIRCCYHGWLFDVDGAILETPGEPANSTLKDRLCHGAYPVHEAHGLVFAYMGPPEQMPDFPEYDSLSRAGYRIIPGQKYFYPCNWLQILENTMDAVHTAFLHTIVSGSVFTDEFGVLPELDFTETPVGIIYIATRRVGENVWARMVENVLPNLQQVAPVWEDGQQAHPFSGPMMSRWIVPLDDTNTMLIELRHVSATDGVVTPAWWADRYTALPGQVAADTYEESQRRPQDFEAQVSQRPIAVHGLEHLGTTDRGISMFRNQIRHGIRAVKAGNDPVGLFRNGSGAIPTYCNDTVVRVPPAKTAELDKKLLRETGRRLAEGYIEAPPLLAAAE